MLGVCVEEQGVILLRLAGQLGLPEAGLQGYMDLTYKKTHPPTV